MSGSSIFNDMDVFVKGETLVSVTGFQASRISWFEAAVASRAWPDVKGRPYRCALAGVGNIGWGSIAYR